MSVFFYYGSLADATITEGDVTCDAQHPITNLNYLDKGLYAKFDDGVWDHGGSEYIFKLINIDMGETITASSITIDLNEFKIRLDTGEYILWYNMQLWGSSDGTTLTESLTQEIIEVNSIGATSVDDTYTEIITKKFTEVSYRYYIVIIAIQLEYKDNLYLDIVGNINNLYIGDYLEMPSPELLNDELEHDVELMTSYGGKRVAVEKQKQRKIWNYDYLNLTDAEKTAQTDFDVVAGRGKIPVYFENVSGTTQKENLTYCRVTNKTSRQETASGNHSTSQIIEEEL